MVNRWRILKIGAVASTLTGGIWLGLQLPKSEPEFQGRTLSDWLGNYLIPPQGMDESRQHPFDEQRDAPEWYQATLAVRQIGTNGIPTLLHLIQARDSKLKLQLISLARKQNLINVSHVSASKRQIMGEIAFEKLGAEAKDAVPALIEILDHSSSQDAKRHAAYALGVIGPQARQAAPSLVRAITNSDSFELWGSCLTALGHIGAEPRLAVPVLVKIYEDPTPCPVPVRAGAVKALGELHGEPELAVPVLIKALRDPDMPNVQQNAIRALSRFGLDAKPAVPALFQYLLDRGPRDLWLRPEVAALIRTLDPEFAATRKQELDAAFRRPLRSMPIR